MGVANTIIKTKNGIQSKHEHKHFDISYGRMGGGGLKSRLLF